ncbi:hypothetical protein GCM10018775_26210 [Streptomyces umbrinus]|nr:hypothetical protein GCM10018775_26210 [Streptomyces umbrinus]
MAGASYRDVGEACAHIAHGFGNRAAAAVQLVTVRRRGKVVGDSDFGPLPALGLVGGGDRDLGFILVGQRIDGGDDGFGSVCVDKLHKRLEISAGRIVLRIVLQLTPGWEENQFGVGCATAVLDVPGGHRQCDEYLPTPGQSDTTSSFQLPHGFGHGADVGAAQHRVRTGDHSRFRRDHVGTGQPDRRVGEREPPIGLFGEERAEAEGAGQREVGGVEACHHVRGTAPPVDGLGRVADHHQLGVAALSGEDPLKDGIGVLGFVKEEEVGPDLRFGQGPHLQVVVVIEAHHTFLGILQICPGLSDERHDCVGELGALVRCSEPAQGRYAAGCQSPIGGLAEAGHGTQHGV